MKYALFDPVDLLTLHLLPTSDKPTKLNDLVFYKKIIAQTYIFMAFDSQLGIFDEMFECVTDPCCCCCCCCCRALWAVV